MRIENILVTKYRMQRRPAIPAVVIRPVACDRGDDARRRHPIASPIWVWPVEAEIQTETLPELLVRTTGVEPV
jgi:hypothetical protein